jgi:hypothetical protein
MVVVVGKMPVCPVDEDPVVVVFMGKMPVCPVGVDEDVVVSCATDSVAAEDGSPAA